MKDTTHLDFISKTKLFKKFRSLIKKHRILYVSQKCLGLVFEMSFFFF